MTALTADAIGAIDSTGQMDEVLGLAEHLRDALWRVDSAAAQPVGVPGGVLVAGMGGSAAGGAGGGCGGGGGGGGVWGRPPAGGPRFWLGRSWSRTGTLCPGGRGLRR